MRGPTIVLVAAIAVALPATAFAQELRNDGFESGSAAVFQGGFVSGEIAAVSLVPPQAGMQVTAVRLLFGGAAGTQAVTLRIWDDSAATMAPGAMVFEGDFQVVGSNDAFHEIDLSAMNVVVPGQFRVGILFQHAGLPSVARDNDGTIAAPRNFIYANAGAGFQWFRSQTLGLTGDWVIRAVVSGGGVTPDAGVTIDAAMTPDAAGPVPDAGAGECDGNGDCIVGEYCDTQLGVCTFDCREDGDCSGDGTCNSLGQCLAADGGDGDGGGCCSTSRDDDRGPWGVLGLAALVGLGASRRRRRRRS